MILTSPPWHGNTIAKLIYTSVGSYLPSLAVILSQPVSNTAYLWSLPLRIIHGPFCWKPWSNNSQFCLFHHLSCVKDQGNTEVKKKKCTGCSFLHSVLVSSCDAAQHRSLFTLLLCSWRLRPLRTLASPSSQHLPKTQNQTPFSDEHSPFLTARPCCCMLSLAALMGLKNGNRSVTYGVIWLQTHVLMTLVILMLGILPSHVWLLLSLVAQLLRDPLGAYQ